jgi:hypothetical protein
MANRVLSVRTVSRNRRTGTHVEPIEGLKESGRKMIGALEKEGWIRDRTEEVFVTDNEIFLSFYHPSFPSCDLVMGIHLDDKLEISLTLRSLDYENEKCEEWNNNEIDLTQITNVAERMQNEINEGDCFL